MIRPLVPRAAPNRHDTPATGRARNASITGELAAGFD
jgi:hypothetical protein